MNELVMAANGGKFPVLTNDELATEFGLTKDSAVKAEKHVRMTEDTHLNWMGDFIVVGSGLHMQIFSIGDILLLIGDKTRPYGFVVWAALAIRDIHERKRAMAVD